MNSNSSGTVCLTFDFDALSLWIASGATSPGMLSRGRFGAEAVPRFLNLLSQFAIPSTWFVPAHTVRTYPDVCRDIVSAGHELALHGDVHEDGSRLTPQQEWATLQRSFHTLADFTGTAPRGNRAPSWDLTAHTIRYLLDLGIHYDSSLMHTDYRPTYCPAPDVVDEAGEVTLGSETHLVEIPVSWTLDDFPAFEYLHQGSDLWPGLRRSHDVFANWTDDVRYMLRDFEDGVLVATFHPQVTGRGHRILGLEAWIRELQALGVQFGRLDHVAQAFLDGRRFGRYRPRQPSP